MVQGLSGKEDRSQSDPPRGKGDREATKQGLSTVWATKRGRKATSQGGQFPPSICGRDATPKGGGRDATPKGGEAPPPSVVAKRPLDCWGFTTVGQFSQQELP